MVSIAWTASDAAKCCTLGGFLGYSVYLFSTGVSGRVVTLRRLILMVEISAIVVFVTLFPPLFLEWQARIFIVDFLKLMMQWCFLFVAYLVSIALYGTANMKKKIPRILPGVLLAVALVSSVVDFTLLILALATDHLIYRGMMHFSVCMFTVILGGYFVWNITQLRLHLKKFIDVSNFNTSAQNPSMSAAPISPPHPNNPSQKNQFHNSSRRHESCVKESNATKSDPSMSPIAISTHRASLQPGLVATPKVDESKGFPPGGWTGGTPRGSVVGVTNGRGGKKLGDVTPSPIVTPRVMIAPRQSACNRNAAKRLKLYRSLETKFRLLIFGAILVATIFSVANMFTGIKVMMLGLRGKKVSTYTAEILEQRKKDYRFLQDLSGWAIILLVWFLVYYSTPRRSSSDSKSSKYKKSKFDKTMSQPNRRK
ncbi:hypothetical protein AAMO2058_000767900 [Amorphochlora amoebiformis]